MKIDEQEIREVLWTFANLHRDWHEFYRNHNDKYAQGKAHTFAYVFSKLCEVLEVDEREIYPDQAEE